MPIGVEVKLSGPFFRDRGPVMRQAIRDALQATVERGEQLLDGMMRPRPAGVYLSVTQAGRGKASTGHFRRNLHGEVRQNVGRLFNNVVYGPWLEGTSSRNNTTRFKGYSMFRKTAQRLNKEAPRFFNEALKRAARRLN